MSKIIKEKIRHKLISNYRSFAAKDGVDAPSLKREIISTLNDVMMREHLSVSDDEKDKIVRDLVDEFMGFGPLEPLLNDPTITEVMINGPKKVYIERGGKSVLSDVVFEDDAHVLFFIQKMMSATRRHIDEFTPYADVSLKDGSRVNIVIAPLALDGPTVTIRKFIKDLRGVDSLIALGTLDQRMSDFLAACIKAKVNILFAGATGAGKTTTLNVFSSLIADDERIITIEDTAELKLRQEHVVRLEARQPNIEGKGEISIRDLFKNSLRMRPERIILGEIRGNEALDLLQANCSGHRGSLAVLHANTPQDVIYRIETMILTSGISMSLEAIHRQIATAIDIIVQMEQMIDGTRKITHITQVSGLKDGQVQLEDIFVFVQEGFDAHKKVLGRWKSTGVIPRCYSSFDKADIQFPKEVFQKDS